MTQKLEITYKIANSKKEFDDGKKLFKQYAVSLNLDLSFQDFTNELKIIDIQYNKPKGALLLAYKEKIAVGCVGIREFDIETAELKRMYVQTEYIGHQISRTLLAIFLEIAQKLKSNKISLDTLPSKTQAQKLYRIFGFYKLPSYRFIPSNGTV